MGRKQVARLMREAGFQGISRRRFVCTTQRDRNARPARWMSLKSIANTARFWSGGTPDLTASRGKKRVTYEFAVQSTNLVGNPMVLRQCHWGRLRDGSRLCSSSARGIRRQRHSHCGAAIDQRATVSPSGCTVGAEDRGRPTGGRSTFGNMDYRQYPRSAGGDTHASRG